MTYYNRFKNDYNIDDYINSFFKNNLKTKEAATEYFKKNSHLDKKTITAPSPSELPIPSKLLKDQIKDQTIRIVNGTKRIWKIADLPKAKGKSKGKGKGKSSKRSKRSKTSKKKKLI